MLWGRPLLRLKPTNLILAQASSAITRLIEVKVLVTISWGYPQYFRNFFVNLPLSQPADIFEN
jgi:hypothetical protein